MIDAIVKEKLETLDGSRGRQALSRAAVRLEDLQGILELPAKLKAVHAAGAEPTAAEFDALVDDVGELLRALNVVVAALQARLIL